MTMHRTQILLEEEQWHRLKARAQSAGRSIGALVRDAVDSCYPADEISDDEFMRILHATHGAWKDRDFADGVEFSERSREGMSERLKGAGWR